MNHENKAVSCQLSVFQFFRLSVSQFNCLAFSRYPELHLFIGVITPAEAVVSRKPQCCPGSHRNSLVPTIA
jgi:hypothetical protein